MDISHHWIVGLSMGVAGAVVFCGFVLQDPSVMQAAATGQIPWGLVSRYFIAMFLGGAMSGYMLSGLFGRSGVFGMCLALLAGLVCALISGLLGSAIGLAPDILADGWQSKDLIPIVAGVLVFPLAVIEYVWLLPIWLVILTVAHVRARALRV